MLDPEHRFYNDLSADEQKHWTSELVKQPATASLIPITYAAYRYHPVTYLFCENDEALLLPWQQGLVKKIEETSNIHIDTETCSAGHSPFLGQPETLLNIAEKIAAARSET